MLRRPRGGGSGRIGILALLHRFVDRAIEGLLLANNGVVRELIESTYSAKYAHKVHAHASGAELVEAVRAKYVLMVHVEVSGK